MARNLFCDRKDLRNEADVEQNFARRLIERLGYADSEILPKQSLDQLTIGGMRGQPRAKYRPDFGIRLKRKVRWIVEAKAPGEDLDDHEWQPRAYCLLINGQRKDERPVLYHILTNGDETRLYNPDLNSAILILTFGDFKDDNRKFLELIEKLSKNTILEESQNNKRPAIRLEKRALSDVNAAFAWCHQHIYKKDDISQSDAFSEFVKLISLKLLSDRHIKNSYPAIIDENAIDVPVDEVSFSLSWIERHEASSHNPINDIQFRNFMGEMEREIARGDRKRIFEKDDQIRLKPETIRGVVRKLQNIFLFGIDADLNGRLFETFLNATMRGKDLGQFFTPRSIIRLGVRLARFKVHVPDDSGGYHTDTVIDACCGSGGFLIDALSDMWHKANQKNISDSEKDKLIPACVEANR